MVGKAIDWEKKKTNKQTNKQTTNKQTNQTHTSVKLDKEPNSKDKLYISLRWTWITEYKASITRIDKGKQSLDEVLVSKALSRLPHTL